MIKAGFFKPEAPLTTQFLLIEDHQNNLCPSFYGKVEDKKKVYHALKETIHPQVRDKWGELKCHCSRIPIICLSKTARNLNKVFLTCGASATSAVRCKYFQWIHTAILIDKRPVHKLKYATRLSQAIPNPVHSIGVQRLPKPTRKQTNGKSLNSKTHGVMYQPAMSVSIVFTKAESQRQTPIPCG